MSYPLGQPVASSVNIVDSTGAPANATTVVLTVTLPDGTTLLPAVTNPTVGSYLATFTPAVPGRYIRRWVATGANASALDPDEFVVNNPAVVPIVSMAEVKAAINDRTGQTVNDDELQQFINAMSDVVEYIVGPVRAQQFTEWHDGGTDTVLTYNRPIITVDAVTEFSGVVSYPLTEQSPDVNAAANAFGYFVYYDRGAIQRLAYGVPCWFAALPWWTQRTPAWVTATPARTGAGQGRVKVTYTAGRATIPDYIKRATLELIRVNYQQTQLGGMPSFGSDYGDDQIGTRVMGYLVPNRVKEMLTPGRQAGGIG